VIHQRCLAAPTTDDQSDKLPTFSDPSFVSGRLGHQRRHWNRHRTSWAKNPKYLEASRSIFSSQYRQNRHKPLESSVQTRFSSEDKGGEQQATQAMNNHPYRTTVRRRSFGGPSGAQRPKAATASGHNMVELSGIEPLTPCLQSRCSPS
jgi:hypothetical protein